MSRFMRISSFKKKKLAIDADSAELLSKIVASHSSEAQPLTESDIIGTVLMNGSVDGRLRFPAPTPVVELNLNLPEASWDHLAGLCEKHGVTERNVIEKVIAALARSLSEPPAKAKSKKPSEKVPEDDAQEASAPH